MSDLGRSAPGLMSWFDMFRRDLPWRNPSKSSDHRTDASLDPPADPWGILVSEIMLQQTPVARVEPIWRAWMQRWPTPADLAAATPAEVIRAWGKLGYPRRALRLHAAANALVERHDGRVPDDLDALLALPGIGDYTAGAILAFAYQRPALALDTNVRRVLARHDGGRAYPAASITAAERARASELMATSGDGAQWMAALMELGALICTSASPHCEKCPVAEGCRWRALGYPDDAPRPRRQPRYDGSDRQARGALLDVLRAADGPVSKKRLDLAWADMSQRERALDSLVADGLVEAMPRGRFTLPTTPMASET